MPIIAHCLSPQPRFKSQWGLVRIYRILWTIRVLWGKIIFLCTKLAIDFQFHLHHSTCSFRFNWWYRRISAMVSDIWSLFSVNFDHHQPMKIVINKKCPRFARIYGSLSLTWDQTEGFTGYSSFLHHFDLVSHDFVMVSEIPNSLFTIVNFLILFLLTLIIPVTNLQKNWKMTETLANGYSSERAQRELSNEYQHDRA